MLVNDQNRDSLIEQYVNGLMTPEDVHAFEQQMESDSELKEEVQMHQQIASHFNDDSATDFPVKGNSAELMDYFKSDEAHKIKNALKNAESKYEEKRKKVFFPKFIAASVIGLIICFSGYVLFKDDYAYTDYYDSNDFPSMISRGDSEAEINAIIESYNDKSYKECIKVYNDYVSSNKTIDERIYIYGGMAYSQIGEDDKAVQELRKLSNSDTLDRSKGLWFIALIHMKNKDEEALKKMLQEIVENPTNFKYQEAKELLAKLN